MPADSRATVARKRSARSKISNGKVLVGGIDGRSAGARRLHDIIAALEADLGGDLGEAERLQVRTAAGLVLHAEQLTADMLNGKPVDSEQVTRTANSAARLLGALRAKRKPKAGPNLADYLASKRAAAEVAA